MYTRVTQMKTRSKLSSLDLANEAENRVLPSLHLFPVFSSPLSGSGVEHVMRRDFGAKVEMEREGRMRLQETRTHPPVGFSYPSSD